MREIVGYGLFPIYHEKTRAGLRVNDRQGHALHESLVPERAYESFDSIPATVVQAVLFVENRELLDPRRPYLNPAVKWPRLAKAVGVEVAGALRPSRPGDRGEHARDPAREVPPRVRRAARAPRARSCARCSRRACAPTRAAPTPCAARRQIVLDYLNSMPLAAASGFGEVHGLGDGLWAWYGIDFGEANRLAARRATPSIARARVQASLSLILAAAPAVHYLPRISPRSRRSPTAICRVLAAAGRSTAGLRDAALGEALAFRAVSPPPPVDWSDRKAANLVRAPAHRAARRARALRPRPPRPHRRQHARRPRAAGGSEILQSLRDPARVRRSGSTAISCSSAAIRPADLQLHALRARRRAQLPARPDRQPRPAARHQRGRQARSRLDRQAAHADHLPRDRRRRCTRATPATGRRAARRSHATGATGSSAWAVEYLATTPAAACRRCSRRRWTRRYSASPGEAFFTGGGLHRFANFERKHDGEVLTRARGFRQSVNLVFIRLMRDIVSHQIYGRRASLATRAGRPATHPRRASISTRFADREGSEFLRRFHREYAGSTPDAGRSSSC